MRDSGESVGDVRVLRGLAMDDRAGFLERLRTSQPEIEAAVFALLERVIVSIVDQYERELEGAGRSPERRRAELVQRLLNGVPVDVGEFG